MKYIKPKKTEYKGIQYKSKLEAVFARFLDLALKEDEPINEHEIQLNQCEKKLVAWDYEPKTISDHQWDFRLVYKCFGSHIDEGQVVTWNNIEFDLIELKPALPNDSYLQYLGDNADIIYNKVYPNHSSCTLIIASIYPLVSYKESYINKNTMPDYSYIDFIHSSMDGNFNSQTHLLQEALKYRFDL